MKKVLLNVSILGILALLAGACSNNAQIVGNINCPSLEKDKVNPTVAVYNDDLASPVVVEKLAIGTVVKVYDYRNHYYIPKDRVRIKTEKNEGWVSPFCLVVNQDPANSVFKWGYRKDYKPFYDSEDREHYNHKDPADAKPDALTNSKNGYEFDTYKNLSKERVSLDELSPELKK